MMQTILRFFNEASTAPKSSLRQPKPIRWWWTASAFPVVARA